MRRPGHADLERVVGHFLHHLSNEPDKTGISPRTRLYGTMPVESALLFPDVSDEVIQGAVAQMLVITRGQQNILPGAGSGQWRAYS